MRGTNRANNTFAYSRDDGFFSRATDEPIEMRTHGNTRFDLHADTVLCDSVNRRAAHIWARSVDHLRIDARAYRFQDCLARSLRGKVDGTGSVEIERDSCLVSGNQCKNHMAHVAAGEVM